jgi:hypothetical protein
VTSSNISAATCPYDLTALETGVPVGITIEWHNQNNTDPSSLVGDPENVSSGVYFAFAKNADGCYSTGTQVTLSCASSSCTAPQTLLVSNFMGGALVSFETAAFPPPADSYTVKRRLNSAPDILGSYTTIGTPTWNSGTNRWEILDTTLANNTLYVYRAQSNCDGGATPSIDYTYAKVICPTVNLVMLDTTMLYSFLHLGSTVTKYVVNLYDQTGVNLLDSEEHLPAFSTTEVGQFIYLQPGTTYKVRLRVYLSSTDYWDCAVVTGTTTASGPATLNWSFDEIGADGTFLLDKNGSAEVTATVDGSGSLSADDDDLIELSVDGADGLVKTLTVEDVTMGTTIVSEVSGTSAPAIGSFNAIASHTYTITATIEDIS